MDQQALRLYANKAGKARQIAVGTPRQDEEYNGKKKSLAVYLNFKACGTLLALVSGWHEAEPYMGCITLGSCTENCSDESHEVQRQSYLIASNSLNSS